MKKIYLSMLSGIALFAVSAPAQATLGIACTHSDISPTAIDCSGFVEGNAIGGSATTPTAATLLAELGYTGSLAGLELIENLNGNHTINFNTLLVGQTIIGVHYGNGQGSPGRLASARSDGDDTAFYLFDAGAGMDWFTLNFNSSSNARLYATGVTAVPEPASWAMMLMGFGAMGVALRRRRRSDTRLHAA